MENTSEDGDWPPNFRCLEDGHGRWVVVNGNYDDEYASVASDPVLARESAWDWWHDVKGQPHGRCDTCMDQGWIDETLGGIATSGWSVCPGCHNPHKRMHP